MRRRQKLLLLLASVLVSAGSLPAQHFLSYGGWSNYPPYPPVRFPEPQRYAVLILEATHDWRFWSPTTRVIIGPAPGKCILGEAHHSLAGVNFGVLRSQVARAGPRVAPQPEGLVIGMGMPAWARNELPPLGDAARHYRLLAAQASPNQRALYRFAN